MKTILSCLAFGGLLVGCGSPPVSQYLISTDDQKTITKGAGAACPAADAAVGTPEVSTIKTDSLLSLFEEKDGTVIVDFASHVFSGMKNGDAPTLTDAFTKEDKTPQGGKPRDRVTSDSFTLTLKLEGDLISGTLVEQQIETCTGTGCSAAQAQRLDCTYSSTFRGRKLPNSGTLATRPIPGQ